MEKKEKGYFFNILLTILNFNVMVIMAVLAFSNVLLTIISILSASVLCGLSIVIFLRKNPYYVIFSYGMAVCVLIFSIGLYLMPEWYRHLFFLSLFVIVIILDVYIIARLIRVPEGSWRVKNPWISYGPLIEADTNVPRYISENYEPLGYNKNSKAVSLEQKRAIRKKYHVGWIILITLISTFSFFSTIILSIL